MFGLINRILPVHNVLQRKLVSTYRIFETLLTKQKMLAKINDVYVIQLHSR